MCYKRFLVFFGEPSFRIGITAYFSNYLTSLNDFCFLEAEIKVDSTTSFSVALQMQLHC